MAREWKLIQPRDEIEYQTQMYRRTIDLWSSRLSHVIYVYVYYCYLSHFIIFTLFFNFDNVHLNEGLAWQYDNIDTFSVRLCLGCLSFCCRRCRCCWRCCSWFVDFLSCFQQSSAYCVTDFCFIVKMDDLH